MAQREPPHQGHRRRCSWQSWQPDDHGLAADPDLDLAGGADPIASEEYRELPGGGGLIPITRSVGPLITRVRPDVMVDFTHPASVMENVQAAISSGRSACSWNHRA